MEIEEIEQIKEELLFTPNLEDGFDAINLIFSIAATGNEELINSIDNGR